MSDKGNGGGWMIKQFKLRLLMVILVVAIASISIRLPQNQDATKLVLEVVLKDYGIQQDILVWAYGLMGIDSQEGVPAISKNNTQVPCEFLAIEREFGQSLNPETGKEEYYPGIRLIVTENTLVKPVMEGKVIRVDDGRDGRSVMIQHNNELYSIYSGLKEVLVEKDKQVNQQQVLGKSSTRLYLELRGPEGPINPQFIME